MALIAPRRRARSRWAALAVTAAAALGILAISQASATTIPGGFFVVNDQQGANDVPGQVDLTRMGRDDSHATTAKIFMSWDSTDSWTGNGQTGDACALFDKNGNGGIDFVICGQITNPNANPAVVAQTPNSPFAFSCNDKKIDRCGTPSPVAYSWPTQIASGPLGAISYTSANRFANLITDTDPFASGSNNPNDSTLEIDILKSTAGGILPVGSQLVNVCSYPSAGNGGNNNPFDCITSPGGGFVTIVKNVAGGTTQSFGFTVAPAPPAPEPATYTLSPTAAKSGTDTTGPIGALIATNESVTETIPSGWTLSSASCSIEGVSGTTGTANTTTGAITGITVASGKVTTCTFNDAPVLPKLTITKTVINDNGGTKQATDFSFTVDGGTATAFTQDGTTVLAGKNHVNTLSAGAHTLAEPSVSGYSPSSWGGDCAADGSITLSLGGTATCTITNDDQAATLIVKKVVVNDSGGTSQATAFSFQVGTATAVSFLQDGADVLKGKNTLTNLSAGTYSVTEPTASGYSTTYDNCTNVVIANGGTATCTITNDDQAATPSGTTAQNYVLFDSLTMSGLRTGATPGKLTFTLWSTKTGTVCSVPVGTPVDVTGVSSNTTYSMATGIPVTDAGTYYWTVHYTGDAFNAPFTTTCGSESTTITKVQ